VEVITYYSLLIGREQEQFDIIYDKLGLGVYFKYKQFIFLQCNLLVWISLTLSIFFLLMKLFFIIIFNHFNYIMKLYYEISLCYNLIIL